MSSKLRVLILCCKASANRYQAYLGGYESYLARRALAGRATSCGN